jgi:hypothetical protein
VYSRQAPESLGLEMSVKGERRTQAHSAHNHEANTVHQAQGSALALQEHLDSRLVGGFIDPLNPQHGHDILLEDPQGLWAQPSLNQGRRLNQDVVAAHQGRIFLDQTYPNGFSGEMTRVVTVQHSKKSGSIDIDVHLPLSSAK